MDPLIVRWDRTVIHPDPTIPGDQTIVCCIAEGGQPVALFLDEQQRDDLRRQLADDGQTFTPHRRGRRRTLLLRRSAVGHH
jgi:hypothetical protein